MPQEENAPQVRQDVRALHRPPVAATAAAKSQPVAESVAATLPADDWLAELLTMRM